MSAGERQLLAISILWGLANSTERSIPTVIDTPLGRLDTQHRENLLKKYFPNASHQVILLSTDTEIDKENREIINNNIGKEYKIEYLDNDKKSQITKGYF